MIAGTRIYPGTVAVGRIQQFERFSLITRTFNSLQGAEPSSLSPGGRLVQRALAQEFVRYGSDTTEHRERMFRPSEEDCMVPRNTSDFTITPHSREGNFKKINQKWQPPFTKEILQPAADESILRFRQQFMKKYWW